MAATVVSNTRNRVPYAEMSAEQKELAERLHSVMQRRLERMPELQRSNNGRVSVGELAKCYRCVQSRQFRAPLENITNFELSAVEAEAKYTGMGVVFERPTLLLTVPMIAAMAPSTAAMAAERGLLPDTWLMNAVLALLLVCAVAYFRLTDRPAERLAAAFAALARRLYKNQ